MGGEKMEKSFKAITPDSTVEKIEDVRIEIDEPVSQKQTLTLKELDRRIAREENQVVRYQASVASLKELRVKLKTEAEKVTLKQPVPK